MRKLVGPATRVIDLRGQLLLPGFNDAHVHFMGIGNIFSSLDLRAVTSAEQLEQQIRRYVQFMPKGRWILGSGWKQAITPPAHVIDRLTPDNPLFIYEGGGSSAFANTAAMRAASLAGAEPSGIVTGATLRKIASSVPADHTRNWIQIAETATNYAASLGVTSVQDMHSDDLRPVYRDLQNQGKLKTRVYDCISLPDWKKLTEATALDRKTEMVRGGCLKSFSEGDPADSSRLLRDAIPADKAGFQLMVHAIGNSANGIVLDVFERIAKENTNRDRRMRVEHAHNPRHDDLPRFPRLGIVASIQPHLFEGSSGGYYLSRLKLRSMVAFGSDAAITDLNPLFGIHAAINAGTESISIYDAVRAYTLDSAYAEFQEKQKGTIEVGKLADFVILSDDIFSVDPLKIRDVTVVMTVVAGKVVYER
ncbi:MAG TPA: amidohydrolase [Pyrinomonadaceae bacterium]|nr:amidohydrolase [Pyrinomonadaceae bacterium]